MSREAEFKYSLMFKKNMKPTKERRDTSIGEQTLNLMKMGIDASKSRRKYPLPKALREKLAGLAE